MKIEQIKAVYPNVAKLESQAGRELLAAVVGQMNALAAENAGLKDAMRVTLEHVSVMDTGQAGVAAMIINDALHHSETPTTDAYLAEVRAQGVEMYAENLTRKAIASGENKNHAYAYLAANFAAQLRQEHSNVKDC